MCVCYVYVYVHAVCACCVCVHTVCARCVCMLCVCAHCVCMCACVHVCLYDDWLLFSSFKQLVEDTPPSDLLSAEEKEELWSTVAAESGVPEVPQVRDTNSRDS